MAANDSGVVSRMPLGSRISAVFLDTATSPCQRCVRMPSRSHNSSTRRNWSLISALSGLRDIATSRYLDRDRLHHVDFAGETFAVTGPAIVPRPPQGQLVVFAPAGLLPGELVDVALVDTPTRADAPLTFVEIVVALDTPTATAEQRLADLGPWPDTGRLRHLGTAAGPVDLIGDLAGIVDGGRPDRRPAPGVP